MSAFQVLRARSVLSGTCRLILSYIYTRNVHFYRKATTQLRWKSPLVGALFRRHILRTSSHLLCDDKITKSTKTLEETKQDFTYYQNGDDSNEEKTPSDGEWETFYEDAVVGMTDDHGISLAEPDSLDIEPFTDVYEQRFPKCPGCGAVFQSDDPEKPGYVMPSKNPSTGECEQKLHETSRTLVCQKCFNLKHYNKPFPITVTSSEIIEYLGHLQRRKGLILYVVDLIDLPGSLFTNILETVGEAKRIIVVGNKLDMLPVDGHTGKQKQHLQEMLFTSCKAHGLEGGNVKSICLVSAKTGFGMLQLASKILEHWDHKGDIYLVGCSNTGKTSLFNLLLDLFSVNKGADLLQRATVSLWPCTTQRMLRFPVSHWMLKKLCRRLNEGVKKQSSRDPEIEIDKEIIDKEETNYRKRQKHGRGRQRNVLVPSPLKNRFCDLAVIEPSFVTDQPNKNQTWLYDTPGIINERQITNLLTMDELKLLNPTLWLVPRTFILKPGQSVLLGALGRVDYLEIKRKNRNSPDEWDTIPEAVKSIFFTVMASPNLPLHICKEAQADQVYDKHAGTKLLGIPCGGKERMETFPPFKSQDFTVTGLGWDTCAADVVLSNIGWVAVTAGNGSLVSLRAHMPDGIGLDTREPALLPGIVTKRGLGWDTCAADVVLSNIGWVAVTAGNGSLVSLRAHMPDGIGLDTREPALLPGIVTKRGPRGVRYQGHTGTERYEGTRRKNPQFIRMVRGQPSGEYKWVQEIKKKRQEQRLLLKFEKRARAADENLLQRSAASNPPQIPGAFGLPLPRGKLDQEG